MDMTAAGNGICVISNGQTVKVGSSDTARPLAHFDATKNKELPIFAHFVSVATMLILGISPSVTLGEILWSGDYETGNFLQWHRQDDNRVVNYSAMPPYARPAKMDGESDVRSASYYGDGSVLELVTSPVRQGRYAAKFTVKNSKTGSENPDCDSSGASNENCDRRRTELTVQQTLPRYYNAMPYMSERWLSASHYVPSNWDSNGSGFGPLVFQIKPLNESGLGPCFGIQIKNGKWEINHRWSPVVNPSTSDVTSAQKMRYGTATDGKPYPNSGNWPDGLRDFPDVAASHAALWSLNKGGWTDWIIRMKFDARGAANGGTGFLTVWKREDSGPWVKVLHIVPKKTTRDGSTFDHGICYNSPASGTNPGGFGIKAGMYMAKRQVWDNSATRTLIQDNVKVGSAKATFATMSPDGSSPDGSSPKPEAPPKPPVIKLE